MYFLNDYAQNIFMKISCNLLLKRPILMFVWIVLIGCNGSSDGIVSGTETTPTEEIIDEYSDFYPNAKYLIEANVLSAMLENGDSIVIIEVSKEEAYNEGHITGAMHIWRSDYNSQENTPYGGMRGSKTEIEALLSRLGVRPNTPIVVYDTRGSVDAIRFIWMLEMYGHQSIYLLNGGKEAWRQAEFLLTTEANPQRNSTTYQFTKEPDYSFLASIKDMKAAVQDTNTIILDTREPEEFLGQPYINKGELFTYKKGAFTHGCIPGAIHLNWSEAVNLNEDHRFYTLRRLKRIFLKEGITLDTPIITYCQSGVRSMHTTYVLRELLGFTNVKNYDGSWIEWTYFYTKDGSVSIQRHTDDKKNAEIREQLKQTLIK